MAAALALTACVSGALAQGYECDRLRERIAAAVPRSTGGGDRYAAAAQKQQYELNRTASYAASIGCNNRQFLMFGSPPPPQCAGLEGQMQRMRANLAGLQQQARASSDDGGRAAMLARYDATCRGQTRGLFDSLFGGDRQQMPLDDGLSQPRLDDDRARGGSQAVCVRTCDGGYFPVSYSARRSKYDSLSELCQAQCPGTETALCTMPAGGSIDQALSSDGDAYKDMPNAGKYRTKFDAACACKPAGKSWVEALAQAEELLGRQSRKDLIVTPAKAEELSRPKVAGAPTAGAAPLVVDETGTTPGKPSPATNFGLKDGETREKSDTAGGKRQIRVIGPKF